MVFQKLKIILKAMGGDLHPTRPSLHRKFRPQSYRPTRALSESSPAGWLITCSSNHAVQQRKPLVDGSFWNFIAKAVQAKIAGDSTTFLQLVKWNGASLRSSSEVTVQQYCLYASRYFANASSSRQRRSTADTLTGIATGGAGCGLPVYPR